MDNSPDKESRDAPTQLRALADDKMASTCAYAADLKRIADEIECLRAWISAIGNLSDVNADERSWMARDALAGLPAPKSP